LPGTLAVFWPANALLLGVLVRCPSTATVTTWPGRGGGLSWGRPGDRFDDGQGRSLNSANLVGVLAGVVLVRRIFTADLRLSILKSTGCCERPSNRTT